MKLKVFTFVLLMVFSSTSAHAGIWDIISAPYNYVADLFSGDDSESVSGSSVVEGDPSMQIPDEQVSLVDDLDSTNLSLSTGSTLPTDYFTNPYIYPYTPSLELSYPSLYTTPNYASPALSFGLGTQPLSFGPGLNQTCSIFDYSLCVFCYSESFALIDELYLNQCESLYENVPDKRDDATADSYCKCHEDKNLEMFSKKEVKDFIKDAVDKKKSEVAVEVIASFQNIAKGVGLPANHPWFKSKYQGDNAKPEVACLPSNFKNIIKNLAIPDSSGNAPCKQKSLNQMFQLAADQADACSSKYKSYGNKPGKQRRGKFEGSKSEEQFCETFGSLNGLKEELRYVKPDDFDGVVDSFSNIFEGVLNSEIHQMAEAVDGRRNIGLVLGSLGERKREYREWREKNNDQPGQGGRRFASEDRNFESNEGENYSLNSVISAAPHSHVDGNATIRDIMTSNTEDFSKTFDPKMYYTNIQELFSNSQSCSGRQCFEMIRVLSTEPFLMGPWMQEAKGEVSLSEDMMQLIKDHGGMWQANNKDKTINTLTVGQMQTIEAHSKKVLDKFKQKAFKFMKDQHGEELVRNINELKETEAELKKQMSNAIAQGNTELMEKLNEQVEFTQATLADMERLKGHLGNMLVDANAFTFDNVKDAMKIMWELQSQQLDQGCKAVQDQVELYCRLNEQPEMYSAADLLDLDFNNNKKIAAELKQGSNSDGSNNSLAILDAMTCMEQGKFDTYPKSGNDLFFINGAGEVDECHKEMKTDKFPSFQKDKYTSGGYSTMIADKNTWDGWSRCEGKNFNSRTSDIGDADQIRERVENNQHKEGASFKDVDNLTLGQIADSYKNDGGYKSDQTIRDLDRFKDKYGDVSSPSSLSDDFFSSPKLQKSDGKIASINDVSGGDFDENFSDSNGEMNGRGPASVSRSNGETVVQNNGRVQFNPLMNNAGEPITSEKLQKVDEQIVKNNGALTDASKTASEIQNKVDQAGEGNVDQSVLDQLAELRKQIAELKQANETLATERKLEIEKLKKEELEEAIAIANANNGNNVTNKPVVDNKPANFSTSSAKVSTTTSGNGSNGVVSGAASGGIVDSSGFVENSGNVVAPSGNVSNVVQAKNSGTKGNNGVFLTGTTSGGEQFNISSSEVLNFEGRSDVTSFDSAVAIAIQSSKNAFVFDGKFYVKKGEEFVEVKDVKEKDRAIASEGEVQDIKDVSALLDRLKAEEEDDKDEPVKEVPVVKDEVKEEATQGDDRKKVRGLWGIIMENVFNFGSSK